MRDSQNQSDPVLYRCRPRTHVSSSDFPGYHYDDQVGATIKSLLRAVRFLLGDMPNGHFSGIDSTRAAHWSGTEIDQSVLDPHSFGSVPR